MAYDQVTQPGTPGAPVTLTVPQGTTKQGVGALLETEGLIEREAFWRLALRIKPSDTPIQAGVYELARGLSPMQILERLYDGPNRHLNANRFRLTIPEGLSLAQMADLFESPDAFLKAAKDGDLLARLGQASPEGFLMPRHLLLRRGAFGSGGGVAHGGAVRAGLRPPAGGDPRRRGL